MPATTARWLIPAIAASRQVLTLRYHAGSIRRSRLLDLTFALATWSAIVERLEGGSLRIRCDLAVDDQNPAADHVRQIFQAVEAWAADGPSRFDLVSVALQSREDYDASILQPEVPPLIGISELAELLGVSRQRASALAKEGRFGPPVAKLGATPVWSADSIEAQLAGTHGATKWERRPGRPKGAVR